MREVGREGREEAAVAGPEDDAAAPETGAAGERPAGISDAAVRARTGKEWPEWFALLDAARGTEIGHKALVALLGKQPRVGPWWRQMIAVAYEQERGLRERHQTPSGFQLNASRTLGASAEETFRAWADDAERAQWLGDEALTIRKAVSPGSLRITWGDGTAVEVTIQSRGPGRCRVVVDHRRLADGRAVANLKRFWAGALDALAGRLDRA